MPSVGLTHYWDIAIRLKFEEILMNQNHDENSVLPTDWTEVIGKVHKVLTQTESSAAKREESLTVLAVPKPTTENVKAWKQNLKNFEERLHLFRAAVQKAENNAEEADLALADAEKTLQQWLTRATEFSSKTI
jgi:hypothetical protein